MEGRSKVAIEAARKVAANVRLEMIEEFPGVEFFHTIPLLALTQFGRWDEVLAEPQPPANLEFSNGIWHYVRATAFAKKGQLDQAKAEREQLVPLKAATDVRFLDSIYYPATSLLTIADELTLGAIAIAEDNIDQAIAHFQIAVATQDELPYTEPPFWYYPTRHTLGNALLAAGRFAEAEATYRKDLELYPRNGWSMFGLMKSLQAQGKDAKDASDKFAQLWAEADITLSASSF
jgi:tetratricopeptide (TPR) repeat protein